MKVFMLGWEFPPFISGGLGTACHGLTKALSELGVEISFVLPKPIETGVSSHVNMLSPGQFSSSSEKTALSVEMNGKLKNVHFHAVSSPLQPYTTPEEYQKKIEEVIACKRLFTTSKEMLNYWISHEPEDIPSGGQYNGDMYTEVHR